MHKDPKGSKTIIRCEPKIKLSGKDSNLRILLSPARGLNFQRYKHCGGSVFFVSDYFISTSLCRRSLSQVPRIEKTDCSARMTLGCTVKLKTPCIINSTSKFALNLVTISINMYLKIQLKNKETSMPNPLKSAPWSHVGRGGPLLGSILAQDGSEE